MLVLLSSLRTLIRARPAVRWHGIKRSNIWSKLLLIGSALHLGATGIVTADAPNQRTHAQTETQNSNAISAQPVPPLTQHPHSHPLLAAEQEHKIKAVRSARVGTTVLRGLKPSLQCCWSFLLLLLTGANQRREADLGGQIVAGARKSISPRLRDWLNLV